MPLSKADAKLHADIIGRWTEELPDGAEAIKSTIYRKDGKLYLERDSDDSDAQTIELVETASPTGVRYDHVPQSETGDYLLIDEAGGLQTWNETGLVSTAMKK
ncbi:MAG: hypothetical protein NXI22_25220 [bacterium]|nr:hypothetical protein [bacterium]